MTTDILTQTINPATIQNQVQESLEGIDSDQVSQDIFDILIQAYKKIVQAPSQFPETPAQTSKPQDPEARKYIAPDMELMRNKIEEQRERVQLFNQILYPTIADIKYSTHYEVFKTLVGEILDEQDAALETKNEHVYVRALYHVSDTIRSIIK